MSIIGIGGLLLLGLLMFFFFEKEKVDGFPTYESDLFWNVVFEWDWRRGDRGFEVIPESIKKICPHCHEDLNYRTEGNYYFLFCNTCKFISSEFFQEPNATESNAQNHLHRELQKKALKNI